MAGCAELRSVPDSQQQCYRSPGTDAGHGGQDRGQPMADQELLELLLELGSSLEDIEKLTGNALDNQAELGGGRDDHVLLVQRRDHPGLAVSARSRRPVAAQGWAATTVGKL